MENCEPVYFETEHHLAKYLRSKSNGTNDWYWKGFKDYNVFFSPNGKWIATVYYFGKNKSNTTVYIPKDMKEK